MSKSMLTTLYANSLSRCEQVNNQESIQAKINTTQMGGGSIRADVKRPKTYVNLVHKSVSQRHYIEQFIQQQYQHHFKAEIHHFFPILISVYDQASDELVASVGMRYADQEALFSEQYLDQPIEEVLSIQTGQQLERSRIIELGHFVVKKRRYLQTVIKSIANYIGQLQSEWTVYTLSQPMLKAVNKLYIPTRFLAVAEANKLIDKSHQWGHYYFHQPAVYGSPIAAAIRSIHDNQKMK